MKRYLNFVCRPFKEHLTSFILLYLLLSVVDPIFCLFRGQLSLSVIIALWGFVIVYFLVYTLCILPTYLKGMYKAIIFILSSLFLMADLFCEIKLNIIFDESFATIIASTNLAETKEFLSTYLSKELFLSLLSCSLLVGIILSICNRYETFFVKYLPSFLFGVVHIALLVAFTFAPYIRFTAAGKSRALISATKNKRPNLTEYEQDFPFEEISNKSTPRNLVIIIGESFSQSHSSLYGYQLKTNPLLEELLNEGNLLCYDADAPALNTIEAFKHILTKFDGGGNWMTKTTLPHLLRKVGYTTYWISNQFKAGIFESFSELCDINIWTNKYGNIYTKDLDGVLIDTLKNTIHEEEAYNKAYIVNMKGSHYEFNLRYPEEYKIFAESDYKKYPEHQRQIRADYDNSILYNDYVVSEIIQLFSDTESIVIYFSDHGIDVYDSDAAYVGHAKMSDEKSIQASKPIPFMIYVSDKYKEKYSEYNALKNSEQTFNSGDLIYLVADIVGIKFLD